MGWIKLDRQIQENFLWFEEPFTKAQAWIDLLLLANHEDSQILYNGEYRTIKRGQHLTSQMKLAKRWKWSRNKVSRFLAILRAANMADIEANHRATNGTLVTIVNYDKFQNQRASGGASNRATNGATNEASVGASVEAQTRRNKKLDIYTAPQMASLDKWLEAHPDD